MTEIGVLSVIKQQGMNRDSLGSHFYNLILINILYDIIHMSSAYKMDVKRRLSPNSAIGL